MPDNELKIDTSVGRGASPRASGPNGAGFEVSVAVHYALVLLGTGEARGLPGLQIDSLAFQRGSLGHPADDVIVTSVGTDGRRQVLGVQAKRSMTFTASDAQFLDVVKQISSTFPAGDVSVGRTFAIAIERTTTRIEGGVQEVLDLARSVPDTAEFHRLMNAPGRTSQAMRDFLRVFSNKFRAVEAAATDDRIFQILRRLLVLVFDFSRPGSLAEHWDKERAARLQTASGPVDGLYNALFKVMHALDGAGGMTTREHLLERLADEGIQLRPSFDVSKGRHRLLEIAGAALSDINDSVSSIHLSRHERVEALEGLVAEAVNNGGCVEIVGDGGVGKSALLKTVAARRNNQCATIVLAPNRTPPGGWPALRLALGVEASAKEFMSELAADGSPIICIDGLDRFDDAAQQKTVIDVLNAVLGTSGLCVLLTTRPGWDKESVSWLPDGILSRLSSRSKLEVDDLSEGEVEDLGLAMPELAPLLKATHPASHLTRNLFRLRRLLGRTGGAPLPVGEAAMAWDWWTNGEAQSGESLATGRAKKRILMQLAASTLAGTPVLAADGMDDVALDALIAARTIRENGPSQIAFAHDVLADWAIGSYLAEDPERFISVETDRPPPLWRARSIELAALIAADIEGTSAYSALLGQSRMAGVHSSWAGPFLVALTRSSRSYDLLEKMTPILLDNAGALASELIRRVISTESLPASLIFEAANIPNIGDALRVPAGPQWDRVLGWAIPRFDTLPSMTLSALIDMMEQRLLLSLFAPEDPVAGQILDKMSDLLVAEVEEAALPRRGRSVWQSKYPAGNDDVARARRGLAQNGRHAPGAVERYLAALTASANPVRLGAHIVRDGGCWSAVAPYAFVSAVRAMIAELQEGGRERSRRSDRVLLSQLERNVLTDRSPVEPFLNLLRASPSAGIALIRDIVEAAAQWDIDRGVNDAPFQATLLGVTRQIKWTPTFLYARGRGSSALVTEMLCSLEYWAHEQIEGGGRIDDIVGEVFGGGDVSAAILLVALDLGVRHQWESRLLLDALSSPEIMALDAQRRTIDQLELAQSRPLGIGLACQYVANSVRSRYSLHDLIAHYLAYASSDSVKLVQDALADARRRLPDWTSDSVVYTNPVYMAQYAQRAFDLENYDIIPAKGENGEDGHEYHLRMPPDQVAWLEVRRQAANTSQAQFANAIALRSGLDNEETQRHFPIDVVLSAWRETADTEPSKQIDPAPEPEDPWLLRLAAAVHLIQDADESTLQAEGPTIDRAISAAIEAERPIGVRPAVYIMYNAQSLAALALIFRINRFHSINDQEALLVAAGKHGDSVLTTLTAYPSATAALPENLLLALFRTGIDRAVSWRRKDWEEEDGAESKRQEAIQNRRMIRLDAERNWLRADSAEPNWPEFPMPAQEAWIIDEETDSPANDRIEPDDVFYPDLASGWIGLIGALPLSTRQHLDQFIEAQSVRLIDIHSRTSLDDSQDRESEWTISLFRAMAYRARDWAPQERHARVFETVKALPESTAFDAIARFLTTSDRLFKDTGPEGTAYLIEVRRSIWEVVRASEGWRYHASRSGPNMEWHLSHTLNAFYFRFDFSIGNALTAVQLSEEQTRAFFPVLSEISRAAPRSSGTAALLLAITTGLPKPVGTALLIETILFWWDHNKESRFWVDCDLGFQLANYLDPTSVPADKLLELSKLVDVWAAAGIARSGEMHSALSERLAAG